MDAESKPHVPSADWIRRARLRIETDRLAIQMLPRLAVFLVVVFTAFAVADQLGRPVEGLHLRVLLDLLLAVSFGALWLAMRQHRVRTRWAQPLALGVALLVLADLLTRMVLLKDPFASLYVVLVVAGLGMFVLSTRWLVMTLAIVSILWAVIAARTTPPDQLPRYLAALAVAVFLAVVGHLAHVHSRRRLASHLLARERRRNELAASPRARESIYRAIVETAYEGIAVIDTTGALTYVNRRFGEMLGYGPDAMLGTNILDLIAPDERDALRRRWAARQRGESERYECRLLRRDGGEAACLVSASPIFDERGRHMGNLGLITDISERKAAEAAVRANEVRYRQLVESLPDIVYSFSTTRGAVFWSNAVERVLGFSADDVRTNPMRWHDAIHPEDLPLVDEAIQRFHDGEAFAIEYRIRDTRGRWHWLYDRSIGRSGNGDEIIIDGVATDVTTRKGTQQALLRSEREYRRLFNAAHDAILIASPEDGTILEANDRACELYGYPHGELVGRPLSEVYADPDSAGVWLRESLLTSGNQQITGKHRRSNGSSLFVESSASVTEYRGQLAVLSVNRDVTASRRAQEDLREQQRLLESLINNLPEGVAILDNEHRVQMTNTRGLRYLADLAGARVGEVASRIGDRGIDQLRELAERGEPSQLVGLPPRQVFQVVTSSLSRGDKPLGTLLVLREVTRDLEIRKQLEQQDRVRAVGQLAAGVAHDFNNILQAIMGFAELIRLEAGVPPSVAARVTSIAEQGERGARLVRQILDFTRKSISATERADLGPLMSAVVDMFRRTIPENIRIETKIEAGTHLVEVDRTQFQQLLTNLIVNARDAIPDSGTIRIGLTKTRIEGGSVRPVEQMTPGEWVLITVTDTGVGMSEEVRSRVFEPFFTTKEPGQGTGLGLSQAYGITKQHRGFIAVDTAEGGGSTFSVYLPPCRGEEPPPAAAREAPKWRGHGELVLVVEDEAMVLEVIRSTLEAWGCLVAPAVSGRRALEIFEHSHDAIAAVISDVVMPDVGGLEIARRIRETDPDVPVVLMSGYPLGVEAQDFTSAANTAWISKPFHAEQLARTLAALLPRAVKA